MLKSLLAALTIIVLVFLLNTEIRFSKAQPLTLTIKPDGNIEPANDALHREGDVYTVVTNLNCSINIQKGDITVNGANNTLQGPGLSQNFIAITIMASNVTVTNLRISGWKVGVYGAYNNNTITNNVFSRNYQGITIYATDYIVSQNSISGSNIGIMIATDALRTQGDNTLITQNQLTDNNWALDIVNSNGTIITKNNITDNLVVLTLGTLGANTTQAGFHLFYLNNFSNNSKVLNIPFGGPFASTAPTISPAGNWDNGTVGNYWDDYPARYPNASEVENSGIGNMHYLIIDSVTWSSDYANGTHKEGNTTLGIATDRYPLVTPNNDLYGAKPQKSSSSPAPSLTPLPTPIASPSAIATSSPTPIATPTTTATIPEYPAWTILVLFAIIALAALYASKKYHPLLHLIELG